VLNEREGTMNLDFPKKFLPKDRDKVVLISLYVLFLVAAPVILDVTI